jgi:hypothetical protein
MWPPCCPGFFGRGEVNPNPPELFHQIKKVWVVRFNRVVEMPHQVVTEEPGYQGDERSPLGVCLVFGCWGGAGFFGYAKNI